MHKISPADEKAPYIKYGAETVEKLRFSDNLCFDFAKHGRPKVPMRKLSTSRGRKTVIHKVNCRIAAREGGLGHAPGNYEFAVQILFYACCRTKSKNDRLTLSTD